MISQKKNFTLLTKSYLHTFLHLVHNVDIESSEEHNNTTIPHRNGWAGVRSNSRLRTHAKIKKKTSTLQRGGQNLYITPMSAVSIDLYSPTAQMKMKLARKKSFALLNAPIKFFTLSRKKHHWSILKRYSQTLPLHTEPFSFFQICRQCRSLLSVVFS